MEEIEKFFRCPHCHEKISMLLDLSEPGFQTYIEDCEVCCRPIQISFSVEDGRLASFSAEGT